MIRSRSPSDTLAPVSEPFMVVTSEVARSCRCPAAAAAEDEGGDGRRAATKPASFRSAAAARRTTEEGKSAAQESCTSYSKLLQNFNFE